MESKQIIIMAVDPDWERKLWLSVEANRLEFQRELNFKCYMLTNSFTEYVITNYIPFHQLDPWYKIFVEFDQFHNNLIINGFLTENEYT